MTLRTKKMIAGGVCLAILGTVALAAGKALRVLQVAGGHKSLTETVVQTWQGVTNPLSEFPAGTQRINVLLIGKDYNHTTKDIVYTTGSRSDTLILFSLDLQNRTVSALSIPRDTYVPERHGKINAAYAQGGAPLAEKTVGDLLGVQPDYYVALKPDGVKALVDEIGGVEVTSLDKMKYDDSWGGLHIDLPAGTYHINGDQAMEYTRFRKPNPGLPHSKEEGDSRRMARQQILVRAMAAKAKTPAVLMKADELIQVALDQVQTDLTRQQLLAIATLFRDIKPDEIQSDSLMGGDGHVGRMYVFKPDPDKTKNLVDWLIRGDANAQNALTVVNVQNGTKVAGAARRMADTLKLQGYDARPDTNKPTTEDSAGAAAPLTSRVVYHKGNVEARAERIAQIMGIKNVVKEPLAADKEAESTEITVSARPADVTVVLGDDVVAASTDIKQSAKL